MNAQEVLIPLMGILLVMIPVTGLTLILTMRFAIKPFVEALTTALRESGFSPNPELHVQMQDLSDQVRQLSERLVRLQQTQDFDRKLLGSDASHRPPNKPELRRE